MNRAADSTAPAGAVKSAAITPKGVAHMMKQLKYAAVLAALVFGTQAWTMAEDTARSADDPSQADQVPAATDDSAQAGEAGQADDSQDASATSDASADDAAQPAAGRDAATD